MPDWMTGWGFIGGMVVALAALVGLLLFLRNQRPD
jgi:hypothetical protein